MNNKISVIIPTYNRENLIIKTIESVLEQSFTNFEVIVIDDCSTDDTPNIIAALQDSRIRYIRLDKNSGAQVARNAGILSATGEWIAFLDSDDIWHKDKLKLQFKVLEENEFNEKLVIHTNCIILDEIQNTQHEWKMPVTEGNVYKLLLQRPSTLFPSILTSKKILLLINLLDENVPSYQEWDTSIQLAKQCLFIHINKPLFTYIQHQNNNISKNKDIEIAGYHYIVNKYKADIIKLGNKAWNNHMLNLADKCISYKTKFDMMDYIAQIKLSVILLAMIRLICYVKISNSIKLRLIRAII